MALHIQKILEFHQSPHAKSETCEKSPNGTVEVGRDDVLFNRNLSRKHRTGPRTTTRPSIQRNTSLSMTRGTSFQMPRTAPSTIYMSAQPNESASAGCIVSGQQWLDIPSPVLAWHAWVGNLPTSR